MKKGIIYSFIISMVICMIMPFTVDAAALSVYFNTDALRTEWNGKILGDYWQYTTTDNATDNDLYIYKFRFDQAYIGQIQFQVRFSGQSSWASGSERVLVAGYESFDWYYREYTIDNQNSRINAVNITSVNLTPLDDFGGDLASIISYLQSIDATEDDIYTVLQSVSSDTETLTKIRQWNFPIESFTAIYPFMLKYTPRDITTYNSYTYPLFEVKQGDVMFNSLYTSNTYYDTTLIFGIDELIYDSNFDQVLTPTNQNYTRSVPETISRVLISSNPNVWYQIVRIDFHYSGTGTQAFGIQFNKNFKILPIYWNLKGNKYLSTDFALQYGLSNQLLDDLHIIAQGTQQSQSAAGDLEQGTSDLASDISSYNQIESDYNNQMNQALNNIDFSDQFSNNQNFLSGASFVKTVFNSFMQIDILRIFFIVLCIVLIAKRFI